MSNTASPENNFLKTVTVRCDDACSSEKKYIFDIIFCEFLGLEYVLEYVSASSEIVIESLTGGRIYLRCDLFHKMEKRYTEGLEVINERLNWLKLDNIPYECSLLNQPIPVLIGNASLERTGDGVRFGFDLLGTCFLFLSRYEEHVSTAKDQHGRFPYSASLSAKFGLILRPIVNEYLELLRYALLDIGISAKCSAKRDFTITPTCDVDRPFAYLNIPVFKGIQFTLEKLFLEKSFANMLDYFYHYLVSKFTRGQIDKYNTFEYIARELSARNLQGEFYFIIDSTSKKYDTDYDYADKSIQKIVKFLRNCKFSIGIHPSYHTLDKYTQLQREVERFIDHEKEAEHSPIGIKSRQHYLRFDINKSVADLESAGVAFDSSLYYSDRAGFRTGCCYSYPLYDFSKKRVSTVIEQNLLFMESSLLVEGEQLDQTELESLKEDVRNLKNSCRLYQGNFMFLWHNSNLHQSHQRQLFEYILDC